MNDLPRPFLPGWHRACAATADGRPQIFLCTASNPGDPQNGQRERDPIAFQFSVIHGVHYDARG